MDADEFATVTITSNSFNRATALAAASRTELSNLRLSLFFNNRDSDDKSQSALVERVTSNPLHFEIISLVRNTMNSWSRTIAKKWPLIFNSTWIDVSALRSHSDSNGA